MRPTLNALDLTSTEASYGALVFGTGNALGANASLDINNRSSHRGASLPNREFLLLGRHFDDLLSRM